MQTTSSITNNSWKTTTQPLTKFSDIVEAICEWDWILESDFFDIVWCPIMIGEDKFWNPIYRIRDRICKPIFEYLVKTFDWQEVVFEKWAEKFFWKMRVETSECTYNYELWDKSVSLNVKIMAENESGVSMFILPKKSDIIKPRIKAMYIVNTWWAERQRVEKEIMAKLVELSMIRGWNEIIQTQNVLEDFAEQLKKRNIILTVWSKIKIDIPWRMVRDTSWEDEDYPAPPISLEIDFDLKTIKCLWYSSHWFGSMTSWWNPCWWNWDDDIHDLLRDCDIKWLINMLIQWSYWYNYRDTGDDSRHPRYKLDDYLSWYSWNWESMWEENKKQMKEMWKEIAAVSHYRSNEELLHWLGIDNEESLSE